MVVIDETIVLEQSFTHLLDYEAEKILYFDIETTGFSPATSLLYLIGCVYFENGEYKLKQFFADTVDSEKELLSSFIDFVHNFSVLVHYNGTGFDIPFIIKKCSMHKIDCDFTGIESYDIYKKITGFNKLLKLENLKQKSIEKFLTIDRDDIYSGGELIEVYGKFLSTKDNEMQKLLLLHNHDDVIGMTRILPIINYSCLYEKAFEIVSIEMNDVKGITGALKKEVVIELSLDSFLPKRISGGNNNFYFTACANTARISIPVYTGELKYFYPNYKDYYYLPDEDRSIHKSVAFYVDKDFRTKAKAANCYSKKTGLFLPEYSEIVNPYFKIDYNDKILYFEYTEDFINDKELIKDYCFDLLKKIL